MTGVLQLQQALHEEVGVSATDVDPATAACHQLSVQHGQDVSRLVAAVQDDPIN